MFHSFVMMNSRNYLGIVSYNWKTIKFLTNCHSSTYNGTLVRMVIDGTTLGTAITNSLTLIPASLFFGFLMLRTGNVIAPAIMHTFTNWISELQ